MVEFLGDHLKHCLIFLDTTNKLTMKYQHLKDTCRHFENILMFNPGTDAGIELYENGVQAGNKNLRYQHMETGYNSKIRQWEHADPPFEIDDLIKYLVENKIRRIISINHYLLEKYLYMKGIFLLSLLDHLGMEYVVYDQDVYELRWEGYLQQELFNNTKWQRYSHSNMHQFWDEKLGHDNVSYIGLLNFTKEKQSQFVIDPDYKILIMSNSRFEVVKAVINPFLFITHFLDDQNIFYNFQIWYRSLRYLILEIMEMDDLEKMFFNHKLTSLFYNSIQLFKYELIENIQTDRKVEIYGDEGWGKVFPQYFQNRYLQREDKDEILSTGKYVMLIPPSFSINILFREFTILDAISKGVPFIYMSSQTKLRGYDAFEKIEYNTPQQLNLKINRMDEIYQDRVLLDTLERYKRLVTDRSEVLMEDMFTLSDSKKKIFDGYDTYTKQINEDIDSEVFKFIDQNEGFLRNCFSVLFKGDRVNFDLTQSKFYNRGYVQKILSS